MRKRRILGSINRIRKKDGFDVEKGLLSSKAELSQHTYEIYQNDSQKKHKGGPELTSVVITRTSKYVIPYH